MTQISKEKQLLAEIAMRKQGEIDGRAEMNATFRRIKQMPTSDKGAVAEEYILLLAQEKLDPLAHKNPAPRDDYDVIILGKKVEVRLATEDVSGNFQFNGTIFNRHEEFFFLLGLDMHGDILFNIHPAESIKSGDLGNVCPMNKQHGQIGSQKFTRKKKQMYDISQFAEIMRTVLTAASA